jgi:GxxExxY protein
MQTSSEKHSQWLAAMRPAMPDAWHRLVETIIGAGEEVHGVLGPGMTRESCEEALHHELGLRGLAVERGRVVRMRYKHIELPEQRLDLVVNGLAAVDVRSVEEVGGVAVAHFDAMLRAADLPVGVLLNFNTVQVRHGAYRRLNRVATAALALFPPLPAEGSMSA